MVACIPEPRLLEQDTALEQCLAMRKQGKSLLEAGDTLGAIACFKQVAALDTDDVQTLLLLGLLFKVKSQLAEAEYFFRLAMTIRPHMAEPHYLLGVLALERGEPDLAIVYLQQALERKPDFEKAYRDLAFALYGQGQYVDAVHVLHKAVGLYPGSADFHGLLGKCYHEQKKTDLALASFQKALSILPDDPALLADFSAFLLRQNRWEEAQECCDKAIRIDAFHLAAHIHRGTALMEQGKLDAALGCYRTLLTIAPEHKDTHFYLGNVLCRQDAQDEAIEHFQLFLESKPENAEGHYNLGTVFQKQDRFDEAVASYQSALRLDRGLLKAHVNLGMVLCKQKKFDAAQACYNCALAIDREYADVHLNQGVLLQAQNRFEEAIAAYRRVLALAPAPAPAGIDAYLLLASALSELHEFDEAWDCYEKVLAIAPDSGDAHFGKALWLLLKGELLSGWREYEYRWQRTKAKALPMLDLPVWLGDADLRGKSILLRAEQGYGDTLQFVRYASQVAQMGATVYLEVYPALEALLRAVPGVTAVFVPGAPLPPCDYQCPLLSLPLACQTALSTDRTSNAAAIPATIPAVVSAVVPYLSVSPERVLHWASQLAPSPGPRVGLAWAGNPAFLNDHNRSLPLAALSPLLTGTNCHFYSLQKDHRDGDAQLLEMLPAVTDLASQLLGFTETAAIIANLDLVITVDTAVAHLAGALGKPVWILLPFRPDWRWLLERTDSTWYPRARLFRQPAIGDWSSVIDQVRQALAELN